MGLIIACEEVPLYSIVLLLPAAFKTPEFERESAPPILIILFVPKVKDAPSAIVTLLKFVGSAIVAFGLVKITVLVPALKVPAFSHAPAAPSTVNVGEPSSEFNTPPTKIFKVLMVVLVGKVGLSA